MTAIARPWTEGDGRSDVRFYKGVVAVNCAVPGLLLIWDAFHHQLGANAVNFAIRTTGLLSLIFLVVSLGVTPVRKLTGWAGVINYRRWLGLWAFFYAASHFIIFFWWDRERSVSSTFHEISTRPYLWWGTLSLLLMAPLATTSLDAAVRALGGKKWKLLHRAAYFAAGLGALHYYLQAKADKRQPLAFAGAVVVLLLLRGVFAVRDKAKAKARVAARPAVWTGELEVLETRDESPTVRTFRLGLKGRDVLPFTYKAGQYLTLSLSIDGKRVRRSYTMASTPTRPGVVELSIKREDMGLVSKHLHHALRAGDRLKVTAPAGKFFVEPGGEGVVLIGAGVGITPVMSMVRYLTDTKWGGKIYFIRVSRSVDEVLFEKELTGLAARHPNVKLMTVLTKTEGRMTGERVTGFVPEVARLPVYLCGPEGMMAATRDLLVKLGVPEGRVKTEAFVSPGVAAIAAAPAGSEESLADVASIVFEPGGESAEVTPELTVLEASEACGANLPYECRAAVCGTCKVKLVAGKVRMDSEDSLSASEKAAGFILACQARAVSAEVRVKA